MTINQTVNVVPNSEYFLELFAILRSDADIEKRDGFEREVHWGIDPFGENRYENVVEWIPMQLTEQNRFGSTAKYPEDIPLVYERITGTVQTADSPQITLFLRVIKKFPDNVEINVNFDDVRLIGPANRSAPVVVSVPHPTPAVIAVTPPTGGSHRVRCKFTVVRGSY